MPLNKFGPGNMYQNFVTHTHSHLAGECPHRCQYCYVQDIARRFPVMRERYSGSARLVEKELKVNYGTGKIIFVENCSDLFAEGIPSEWIHLILHHCCKFPENAYVFQTKNPGRIGCFYEQPSSVWFPPRFMIGTTAETDDFMFTGTAPSPLKRLYDLKKIKTGDLNKFVTIEPITRFHKPLFLDQLLRSQVPTIYIGADSKKHGLPEPTGQEIGELIKGLREAGRTVVLKSNLKRLYVDERR